VNSLVSVVIPCYNAQRWIGKAIQSCLNQTYHPLEVIVVDDGSTDHSKQIVLAAARNLDIDVRLIECTHKGASATRNQGLAAAAGDHVQFLDADDLMSPRKIELQAAAVAHSRETVPCGPWLWFRQSNGLWRTEQPRQHMRRHGDFVRQWLEGNFFAAHCFLWPRKAVIDLGGWDESLTAGQDSDLYIRAILKNVQFCFVPESVVYYRTGHANASVSCRRTPDTLNSWIRVLNKVQAALKSRGDLQEYRPFLAQRHYLLARGYALNQSDEARKCFRRFREISPDGRVPGSLINHVATRLLGVVSKEKLSRIIKLLWRDSNTFKSLGQNQKSS
jgi:glycosyltransferase involved in cell wall biosynthesis